MIEIEFKNKIDNEVYDIIGDEFNKYANENKISCDYKSFAFIAKENNKIVGVLTGHSYYKEIHVEDLVVLKEYRKNHIGFNLMKSMEDYFKNKDFENINLTTYEFQAPEFYEKCGYTVEFIRMNKLDSKLNKYFLIKYM